MDLFISWIIKSILISGILYVYYRVSLRNKKIHQYNRFYLLAAIAISLVLPLLHFNWYDIREAKNVPLNEVLTIISAAEEKPSVLHFTTSLVLAGCVAVVSLVLFMLLLSKVIWIYRIKRKCRPVKMNGFNLIETPVKQAPFSFLNNLFWKQDMSATDANGEKIFKHELTHIKQRHTYDKLFAQVVMCIGWVNPFYWLLQRELNMVHEFMADAQSVHEGDTESFALMLLHAHNEGKYLTPAHSFSHSPVKRRLLMIGAPGRTRYALTRKLLPLPLMAGVLLIFSFEIRSELQQHGREQKLRDEKMGLESSADKRPYSTVNNYYCTKYSS